MSPTIVYLNRARRSRARVRIIRPRFPRYVPWEEVCRSLSAPWPSFNRVA